MKKIISILSVFCLLAASSAYSMSKFNTVNAFVRHWSVSDGLSNDEIVNMTMQDDGRLWVSTGLGFSIINNGYVTSYTYYKKDGEKYFLNRVLDIAADKYAVIATESNLLKFNPSDERFEILQYDGLSIIASAILDSGGLLYLFVPSLQSVLCFDMDTQKFNVVAEFPHDSDFFFEKMIFSKASSDVLIMSDASKGVFEINLASNAVRKIENLYNNPVPSSLFIDSYGILWCSSKSGGLIGCLPSQNYSKFQEYFPGKDGIPVQMLMSMDEMPGTKDLILTSNGGGAFFISRTTGKVTDYFDLGRSIFLSDVYVHSDNELFVGTRRYGVVNVKNASILTNVHQQKVTSVFEGGKGFVYCVANPLGLVQYDERTNTYISYPSTANLAILSMCKLDSNTLLLLVNGGFLYELDIRTGVLKRSSLPEVSSESEISCNNDGYVFLLNTVGNSYRYNVATKEIDYFRLFQNNEASNRIICTQPIGSHSIIITTLNKIYELDQKDLWLRELSSSEKRITWSQADRNGVLWYITIDGLMRFTMTDNEGAKLVLPTRPKLYYTSMVIEDTQLSRIYLTTSENHVLVYNPVDGESSIVGSEDCLLSNNSFGTHTFCSSTGCVYLPGSKGLTIIPIENDEQFLSKFECDIKCTGAFVNGDFFDMGSGILNCISNNNVIVNYVVNTTSPVNNVSIAYRVVNNDGETVREGSSYNNSINLGALSSGRYSLQVSKVLRDGRSEWEHMADINVLGTSYTFMIFAFLFLLLVVLTICILAVRLKKLNRYICGQDKQMQQNIKMYQSNNSMVYDLFCKCVKEIKTPMSIIYNQMFRILRHNSYSDENGDFEKTLRKIDRLATMLYAAEINDDKIPVNISSFALNRCLDCIIDDYKIECKIKKIHVIEKFDTTITNVNLDRSMLETIFTVLFFNIISNQKSGNVMVFTSVESSELFKISLVTDEKICQDNISSIRRMFTDPFFNISSFGIGFYKANLLARRLGNEGVFVEENASGGLSFHIMLSSFANNPYMNEMSGQSYKDVLSRRSLIDDDKTKTLSHSILIVDDNVDLLDYMENEFKGFFMDIYKAKNGKEALNLVRKVHPSVVVTDVMMPLMNGIELCKEIKSDLEISHTLVILRSSKDEISDVSYGYKTTADKFIPKPFDINALFFEIKSLLENRYFDQNNIRILLKENDIKSNTYSIADEKFMLHLGRFIYSNLHNPLLNQQMIAAEMNLPETIISKKIHALSGVFTERFLNLARVELAKEMLVKSPDMPLFDISTQLGFHDSDSFVAIFTQETCVSPQQYRENPS